MLPLFFTLKPSKKDDTDDESNVIYLKDCINTDHGNVKDVHRNGIGIRSVAHGLNCYGRGQLGEKLITNLPGLGKALKTATEAKEIAERNNEDTNDSMGRILHDGNGKSDLTLKYTGGITRSGECKFSIKGVDRAEGNKNFKAQFHNINPDNHDDLILIYEDETSIRVWKWEYDDADRCRHLNDVVLSLSWHRSVVSWRAEIICSTHFRSSSRKAVDERSCTGS